MPRLFKSNPKLSKFLNHISWRKQEEQENEPDEVDPAADNKSEYSVAYSEPDPALGEERVRRFKELYEAGVPLYTVEDMKDLERQIMEGSQTVSMKGMDGEVNQHHLPRANEEFPDSGIGFLSYQEKVDEENMTRIDETEAFCALLPVRFGRSPRRRSPSTSPVRDTLSTLDEFTPTWRTSEECRRLRQILQHSSLQKITKIVGFALGELEGDRSFAQHAVVLGLAGVLHETRGNKIQCYVQDPAYSQGSEKVLTERGITVLRGIDGFLKVDAETVVITVCPNVCVKQIITEIARPAMMILDKVKDDGTNFEKPRKMKMDDGETRWVMGYSTDPDSPRIWKMVTQEYERHPFPCEPKNFGCLEVCIRKDGDGESKTEEGQLGVGDSGLY